jgi:hypothetical protein
MNQPIFPPKKHSRLNRCILHTICLPLCIGVCQASTIIQHETYEFSLYGGELTFIGTYEPMDEQEHVVIPAEIDGIPVVRIADQALSGTFPLMQSIVIPDNVYSIGEGAFNQAISLTNIAISAQVSSIGRNPFARCTNLQAIAVSEDNLHYSSLDGVLFNKQQTTLLQYPGGKSGPYIVPTSVTNIAKMAFASSPFLTGVTLSTNLISIGDSAFVDCENLTDVIFNNSLKDIGHGAFFSCSSLANIHLPGNLVAVGKAAFAGTGLTNISVSAENPYFEVIDGVLIESDGTILIHDPSAITSADYVIPTNVSAIANGGFWGNTVFTNVIISSGVITVGEWAFAECSSMTSVVIADSVTTLGEAAFIFSGLTAVTVPDSVHTVGGGAFSTCTNLVSAIIGYGVLNLGDGAFSACTSLTGVYFRGDAPTLGTNVFLNATPTIYYLQGASGFGETFGGRPTAVWNP